MKPATKKISIILPIYNGATWLPRCIDSILAQDFDLRDVEVLLLNDGSTDSSMEVIQRYKTAKPALFRVIDQANMGVAKTRNKAIDLATGEYIVFIDQDDWLDDDFLSTYYDVVHAGNLDVVIGGYRRPNSEGKIVKLLKVSNTDFGRYSIMPAWGKIHRTNFLRQNKIQFFNNPYGEDLPFTCRENLVTMRYKIIPYIGYNWFYNEKSVSNTSQKGLSDRNLSQILTLLTELKKIEVRYAENTNAQYSYIVLRTAIYTLLYSGKTTSPKCFMSATDTLFGWLHENLESLFAPGTQRLKYPHFPKGEQLIYRLAITIFIALYRMRLLSVFARFYCRG